MRRARLRADRRSSPANTIQAQTIRELYLRKRVQREKCEVIQTMGEVTILIGEEKRNVVTYS